MPKKKRTDEQIPENELFASRSDAGTRILQFLSLHDVALEPNVILKKADYAIQGNYIQTAYQLNNNGWCKSSFICYEPFDFCKFSNGDYVTVYDMMKILIRDYADEISKDNYLLFSKIVAEIDEAEATPTPAKVNIVPWNKLSQKLPLLELVDADAQYMKVLKKKNHDVLTTVDITTIDKKIELPKQIEPFDMVIHSGVLSLYDAGNVIITPQMINRHISGGTKQRTTSKQRIKEIENSLDKMRNTNITIDCTDEIRLYHKEPEKGYMSDRMLPARKMAVYIGGQWITGYKMQDKPILRDYAEISGQIARYPTRLLGLASEKYSDNKARISIKYYILNRISSIKHGNKIDSITYDTIFKNCGLSEIDRNQKSRHREFIRYFLTELRNDGYITDFSEEKTRKIIIKI